MSTDTPYSMKGEIIRLIVEGNPEGRLKAIDYDQYSRIRRIEWYDDGCADAGEALGLAWGVIANVSEGNWTKQTHEWQEAAARWRDEHWHPWLDENVPAARVSEEAT